jgi:transglutaminase-like putative cysteine protease
MRLSITHKTKYSYLGTVTRLVQAVRLFPTSNNAQQIIQWQVQSDDGRPMQGITDGFGNLVQLHALRNPGTDVTLTVTGSVLTFDTGGIVENAEELLPPLFYTAQSFYTQTDSALISLAETARKVSESDIDVFHHLMLLVREQVEYVAGVTLVTQTAAEVLKQKSGVCQDHAHIMIAAARHLGYPSRYVSGYLWTPEQTEQVASHAWMEVRLPNLGWLGFDPANRICPDDRYVRLACGRDYADAAPVRGVRIGGAKEALEVRVQVKAIEQQ